MRVAIACPCAAGSSERLEEHGADEPVLPLRRLDRPQTGALEDPLRRRQASGLDAGPPAEERVQPPQPQARAKPAPAARRQDEVREQPERARPQARPHAGDQRLDPLRGEAIEEEQGEDRVGTGRRSPGAWRRPARTRRARRRRDRGAAGRARSSRRWRRHSGSGRAGRRARAARDTGRRLRPGRGCPGLRAAAAGSSTAPAGDRRQTPDAPAWDRRRRPGRTRTAVALQRACRRARSGVSSAASASSRASGQPVRGSTASMPARSRLLPVA